MHILFISTHNFATNPRLVKEIELALDYGYEVSIVCCDFDNWSKPISDGIYERFKERVNCYFIPGNRRPFRPWLVSSFLFKLSALVLKIFPDDVSWLSISSNKRSWLLQQHLKKIHKKVDLVVAHNPGSFYPAQWFAIKNNIPFAIDIEDYHPGETNDAIQASNFKSLSKKVLPAAAYLSAASPLILEYTLQDTGPVRAPAFVLLNYFSGKEFSAPEIVHTEALQLVWFSQYISFGRGLEELIPAVKMLDKKIALHLYGNLDNAFYEAWLREEGSIILHPPLPQALLHKELALYDAGMALENTHSNLNRDLCITNKILSYLQAGLFIIASGTTAQKHFIAAHPLAGVLVQLTTQDLVKELNYLYDQKENIRANKAARFAAGNSVNWETASTELLSRWAMPITSFLKD